MFIVKAYLLMRNKTREIQSSMNDVTTIFQEIVPHMSPIDIYLAALVFPLWIICISFIDPLDIHI